MAEFMRHVGNVVAMNEPVYTLLVRHHETQHQFCLRCFQKILVVLKKGKKLAAIHNEMRDLQTRHIGLRVHHVTPEAGNNKCLVKVTLTQRGTENCDIALGFLAPRDLRQDSAEFNEKLV